MKKIIIAGVGTMMFALSGCSTSGEALDGQSSEEIVPTESPTPEAPTDEDLGVIPFGETYEFPDGLRISVEPTGETGVVGEYDYTENSSVGDTCYYLEFTVENGTDSPYDGSMVSTGNASYVVNNVTEMADEIILDSDSLLPRIMPGREASIQSCYAIPEEGVNDVYIDWDADDYSGESMREITYWSGSVGS